MNLACTDFEDIGISRGGTTNCATIYRPVTPIDERQIRHLVCVRLKHLLYDFLGGVLGLLPVVFLHKRPKTPP